MTFLHLSCVSERTLGRGMIRPAHLVKAYKEKNIDAACITDFGNISAAVQLSQECKKNGMKPMFGVKMPIAHDKKVKSQNDNTIILIAKNRIGFRNLVQLVTIGSMYFYYVPRIDFDSLKDHAEGLIVLTSDHLGIAGSSFFAGGLPLLSELYKRYSDVFGDDFYFQIQTDFSEPQRVLNNGIIQFAEQNNIRNVVATGDPHYIKLEEKDLHMRFMQIKNSRNDSWSYPLKGDHHLTDYDEMLSAFFHLNNEEQISPVMMSALDMPFEICEKISIFDPKDGVRIPKFIQS